MPDFLHVCMVVDEECLERFEPVVRQLSVGFVDEAIRTTIVGPRLPGVEALAMGPIQVCTYDRLTGWRRKRSLSELLEAISARAPHLVHSLSTEISWLAAQIAGLLDVPLVASLNGLGEITERTEPILRSASTVVAVSEPLRAMAMQRLGKGAQHVLRVRWGVLPEEHPSCFLDEQKNPTVITITPLSPDAGLEHVIDAVARLSAEPLPAMLFILGEGPAENDLRQRANRLGLNERVTFAGPVREWASILNGADIFVLPSRQSRLTIHPLAAMAAGLVVVAPGAGGHDCLIDGQTARIYHPPSAELLGAVLAEAIANPEESRRLAARAQEYVREHHRISTMVMETVQLYRQLTLNRRTILLPGATASGTGET
jgi:glycosyltransferase involved in cell wall biosynthesis